MRALCVPPEKIEITQQDAENMQALGITADMLQQPDPQPDVVDVWPDLYEAFGLFEALQTQWRISMAGATGLDYAAVPLVARMRGIATAALRALWPDLQAMERKALVLMHQRRAAAAPHPAGGHAHG